MAFKEDLKASPPDLVYGSALVLLAAMLEPCSAPATDGGFSHTVAATDEPALDFPAHSSPRLRCLCAPWSGYCEVCLPARGRPPSQPIVALPMYIPCNVAGQVYHHHQQEWPCRDGLAWQSEAGIHQKWSSGWGSACPPLWKSFFKWTGSLLALDPQKIVFLFFQRNSVKGVHCTYSASWGCWESCWLIGCSLITQPCWWKSILWKLHIKKRN